MATRSYPDGHVPLVPDLDFVKKALASFDGEEKKHPDELFRQLVVNKAEESELKKS